ncbi:MAG TPA: MarR family transcriptional regulator [Oceanospirillales bacterium]|nr:MarR family transcriptional regulator [Oceanospirillales bacterium]|tara:strand:- start:263 stop:733 length:471 start_codon:yes stop_codon:yes gene_type:complete
MSDEERIEDVFPALHLENQLCFSLYRLSRTVTQSYTPLLKPLDITYPQYLVLLVLWENEEEGLSSMTVSQLTEALQLDTGTVTPLLKRMEAKGILGRQRDSKDERVVLVQLTDHGRGLRELAKPIPAKLLCQAEMEPSELLDLQGMLRALLKKINP